LIAYRPWPVGGCPYAGRALLFFLQLKKGGKKAAAAPVDTGKLRRGAGTNELASLKQHWFLSALPLRFLFPPDSRGGEGRTPFSLPIAVLRSWDEEGRIHYIKAVLKRPPLRCLGW
jgi:hypothetical protein